MCPPCRPRQTCVIGSLPTGQRVTSFFAAGPGRGVVACLTAIAVLAAQLPVHAIMGTPAAAQGLMSRADYEACQGADEAGFRRAIESLTLKGLQAGVASIDYRAVVGDEWRRSNMDDLIDKQVDQSVNEVREETSWGRLLQSLASKERAQELATTVAERVYKSESVKHGIETLAGGVGRAVGRRIEMATADTAEPAMNCMQAFLGQRYGTTVARVVSRDAGNAYKLDPSKTEISTGALIAESAGGIAGAVILVVRRQLANMASRVGARVVGSVLSRLVTVVAGGIGVVLIAKDIWDFRHGVLPIIATEMKSPTTKEKVQDELAAAIRDQINDNLKEISARTAERVVDVWQEFRRAHAKVLALADTNADFKRFLENVRPEALARLDEVVSIIMAGEGEPAVLKRLADGTLDTAVNRMSAPAFEIARDQKSIEAALAWTTLAGDRIGQVVEWELFKKAKPADLTRATLNRLLDLNDRIATPRLAAIKPLARAALFELDDRDLRTIGRALGEAELESLATYHSALEKTAATRVLRSVAQTPAKMQVLARASVRDAILASKDQAAAVGMVLKANDVFDPAALNDHVTLVTSGRVSPILMWEVHGTAVSVAAVTSLLLLLALLRLMFGRRPRVIVRHAGAPPIRSRR